MIEFEGVKQHGPATVIERPRERAILVGVDRPGQEWSLSSSMAELERLAWTAGADMVASTTQRLDSPNPRTFVGSGKAEEIASLARSYAADVVIFDDELTPSQQSNLEGIVGKDVKVIDRTALILISSPFMPRAKKGAFKFVSPRISTSILACAACGRISPPTGWVAVLDRASAKEKASSRSTDGSFVNASPRSDASWPIFRKSAIYNARIAANPGSTKSRLQATRTPASPVCSMRSLDLRY